MGGPPAPTLYPLSWDSAAAVARASALDARRAIGSRARRPAPRLAGRLADRTGLEAPAGIDRDDELR